MVSFRENCASEFAQLALILAPDNGKARALFTEVCRAMGLSVAATRLENVT